MYSVCKSSSPNRRNVGHSIDLLLPWVLSLSLIRAEQQLRVPKTDAHNYIGTPCTLSARAAHLIGGMSDTPLTCYSVGSLVQYLIRAEQQRRVLKTDTHNYIGTRCSLSARAAHLIGGMSDTPLTCYSLGS